MLKPTLTTLLSLALPALAAHPPANTCLTSNPGCASTLALIQRCWDTGVPSGLLNPNDPAVSSNLRTCFCGDERTNADASWPICAACLKAARTPHVDTFNAHMVRFCATPDPNAFLFLTALLNLTSRVDPDDAPAVPGLEGPVTEIASLAPQYSPDPSANAIPDGVFFLTTQTVASLPPPSTTALPSSSSTTSSSPSASASSSSSSSTGAGEAGVGSVSSTNKDATLTILYYTNAATRMYVVGPATALAGMTSTAVSGATTGEGESAMTGEGESVTTGVFVAGGRTVLLVGPATATGAVAGEVGRVRVSSAEKGRAWTGKWAWGVVGMVVGGVVVVVGF